MMPQKKEEEGGGGGEVVSTFVSLYIKVQELVVLFCFFVTYLQQCSTMYRALTTLTKNSLDNLTFYLSQYLSFLGTGSGTPIAMIFTSLPTKMQLHAKWHHKHFILLQC